MDDNGWFVVNARDALWRYAPGRPALCDFEGDGNFPQVGVNMMVLEPGVPMAMYHWEADQEDFFVLAGEAVLVVEGEERPLKQWDFFHCPAKTKHVIVGAGDGPCVVFCVGARIDSVDSPDWGGYTPEPAAATYGASVTEPTNDPEVAYADVTKREKTSYREGWLPG